MSFVPQAIIETDRLRLRPVTLDDSSALFELNRDPEVVRFTGQAPMSCVAEAEQMIRERILPDYARNGYSRWAVTCKASGDFVGLAGLKRLDELAEVDVGYKLRREFWGQGLATEAARASVDYGFRVLDLPRIIGLVDAPHIASIRVLEKSGFKFERIIEYRSQEVLQYAISKSE